MKKDIVIINYDGTTNSIGLTFLKGPDTYSVSIPFETIFTKPEIIKPYLLSIKKYYIVKELKRGYKNGDKLLDRFLDAFFKDV